MSTPPNYKSFSFFQRSKGAITNRLRTGRRAAQNLGVIDLQAGRTNKLLFRNEKLAMLDQYYENKQYERLPDWDSSCDEENYVEVRKRRPRIIVPVARSLWRRVVAMMIGGKRFPTINIEDSPEDQEFVRAVIKASRLKSTLLEPMRRCVNTGSVFLRFYLVEGVMKMEYYRSVFCWPEFSKTGQLEKVEIRYIYEDPKDTDKDGNCKWKWYRIELARDYEVIYDNPEYDPEAKELPEFKEVERVDHGLGFVQGTWFKTTDEPHKIDGVGYTADIMDMIDDICYSKSQTSQALGYNQEPQLAISGIDETEVGALVRSVTKTINLGREGEAAFLEAGMNGVTAAKEDRQETKQLLQDSTDVNMMDAEKMVGAAQSAKAMEVLNGPMVEFVEELRGVLDPQIMELIAKMCAAILLAFKQGIDVPINLEGYTPKNLDFELTWPPVFEDTIADKSQKISMANTAVSGMVISQETATRYVKDIFNIEDIEEERAKIAAQPPMNPFGTF